MPAPFRLSITRGRMVAGLLAATSAFAAWTGAATLEEERAFLKALREARLFSIADGYLAERSNAADVAPDFRELYAEERIALAEIAALEAPAERRGERLADIEAIAAEYLATIPPAEPAIETIVASARARLALADQWRREAELNLEETDDPTAGPRGLALGALRSIERDLDDGLERARTLAADAARRPAGSAETRALALSQELRFLSALVYRARALCYPTGTPDRFDAQHQATERLDELLSRMTPDQSAWTRTLAERARAYREAKDYDRARTELDRIVANREPDEFSDAERDAFYEERVRLLLDQGDADAALGLWERIAPDGEPPSPALGLVAIDVFIARAAELRAENDTRATGWEKKAAQASEYLERRYGPYWGRLASRRMVEGSGESLGDAAALARMADDHLRQRNLAEALLAYDKAAAAASGAGSGERALYAYRAALVEQARGNHAAASDRLATLARSHPTRADAAERHYLAIWNAAEAAKADPIWLDRYAELLDEHLSLFPRGVRADRVRVWSGRWQERRGQLAEAFAIFLAVAPTSDAFPEAASAAVAIGERLIGASEATQRDATRERIERAWDTALQASEKSNGADAAIGAATLAIGLGRSSLERSPAESDRASEFANLALARIDSATNEDVAALRAQALSLRVGADFADADRRQAVEDAIVELSASGMTSLEPALAGLERSVLDESDPRRAAAATWTLQALALVPATEREDATQSARFAELRAKALAALGRGAEARDDLRRLATERPGDAEIQLLYARSLDGREDEGQRRAALDQWRRIAARATPRSDVWFEAKLAVARRQIALGQANEAATLLKYVRLAPPGLAGTKWERPYQEALREAETRNGSK